MSKITWRRGSKDPWDGELAHVAELDGKVIAQTEAHEGTPTGYWGRYRGTISGIKGTQYAESLREFKQRVANEHAPKQEG